jgi:hypothetical protein
MIPKSGKLYRGDLPVLLRLGGLIAPFRQRLDPASLLGKPKPRLGHLDQQRFLFGRLGLLSALDTFLGSSLEIRSFGHAPSPAHVAGSSTP